MKRSPTGQQRGGDAAVGNRQRQLALRPESRQQGVKGVGFACPSGGVAERCQISTLNSTLNVAR